jgi:small GTP-binding protein
MIVKKVCMLGGYAVGKTSLVKRFVHGIFSDRYLTTIGVKIEKKSVQVEDKELSLVIWDLAGENGFEKVRLSYLRGASGYLLVADGTRAASLQMAIGVHEKAQKTLGDVPFLLLMNKCDLREQWTVTDAEIQDLRDRGWRVLLTSAKDDVAVEEAFDQISVDMLSSSAPGAAALE